MEAAYEFALNRDKMDFALSRIWQGYPIPGRLFVDILTEKCQLINQHLRSMRDCLMIVSNLSDNRASIKFHDIHYEDSVMRHIILTNKPDLDDQLIYLWMEVRDLLRYFHIDDHATELASIDTFYHELEYNEMVAANFML